MISQEDCIALSGLEAREIAVIAEHEHISEIAAAALGSCLLREPDGAKVIWQILTDDIEDAFQTNRLHRATDLLLTLRGFINRYPHAVEDPIAY